MATFIQGSGPAKTDGATLGPDGPIRPRQVGDSYAGAREAARSAEETSTRQLLAVYAASAQAQGAMPARAAATPPISVDGMTSQAHAAAQSFFGKQAVPDLNRTQTRAALDAAGMPMTPRTDPAAVTTESGRIYAHQKQLREQQREMQLTQETQQAYDAFKASRVQAKRQQFSAPAATRRGGAKSFSTPTAEEVALSQDVAELGRIVAQLEGKPLSAGPAVQLSAARLAARTAKAAELTAQTGHRWIVDDKGHIVQPDLKLQPGLGR